MLPFLRPSTSAISAVRRTFSVCEPQRLLLARIQLFHGTSEVRAFDCARPRVGRPGNGLVGISRCILRLAPAPSQCVVSQVRCNSEQVIPAMSFALERPTGSENSVIALLEEIIGERFVTISTVQKHPHLGRSLVVETVELVLVHLESFFGFA
jgi:hypothetical protein